jgi:hypothetical protein
MDYCNSLHRRGIKTWPFGESHLTLHHARTDAVC